MIKLILQNEDNLCKTFLVLTIHVQSSVCNSSFRRDVFILPLVEVDDKEPR